MAAAALVELWGGSPAQLADAVAIALKNVLGLVCDPVAGLVEIPCIKRNASGVAGAFVAAELALAGMGSAIPADEVIWAMKKVGQAMPPPLKETAEGGLAATPTAQALHQQVFGPSPPRAAAPPAPPASKPDPFHASIAALISSGSRRGLCSGSKTPPAQAFLAQGAFLVIPFVHCLNLPHIRVW